MQWHFVPLLRRGLVGPSPTGRADAFTVVAMDAARYLLFREFTIVSSVSISAGSILPMGELL
ncbi:MAG: hypothetical protein OXQ90_06740 [Gammaproteobacteria bacterium]|nr:hypothetical protein [Gammaproteobacteria bacterium]